MNGSYNSLLHLFDAVADALREKRGDNGLISANDFPSQINSLTTARYGEITLPVAYWNAGEGGYIIMLGTTDCVVINNIKPDSSVTLIPLGDAECSAQIIEKGVKAISVGYGTMTVYADEKPTCALVFEIQVID